MNNKEIFQRVFIKRKQNCCTSFTNPIEVGGGVFRGAKTQEEYICRASNLYNCLIIQEYTGREWMLSPVQHLD